MPVSTWRRWRCPSHRRTYLGHEMVGEVIEVGDDVTGLTVGDRVVRWGRADDCRARGRQELCRACARGHRVSVRARVGAARLRTGGRGLWRQLYHARRHAAARPGCPHRRAGDPDRALRRRHPRRLAPAARGGGARAGVGLRHDRLSADPGAARRCNRRARSMPSPSSRGRPRWPWPTAYAGVSALTTTAMRRWPA